MAGTRVPYPHSNPSASGGGGSGDVSGPASATDNAALRADGTTGKVYQDSLLIITDTGGLETAAGKYLSFGTGNADTRIVDRGASGGLAIKSGDNAEWRSLEATNFFGKTFDGTTTINIDSGQKIIGMAAGWVASFNGLLVTAGAGTPEAAVTAPVGSMYLNSSGGGVLNTLWLKMSGTGNTGWVGVA